MKKVNKLGLYIGLPLLLILLTGCSDNDSNTFNSKEKVQQDVLDLSPLRAFYTFIGSFKDSSDYANDAVATKGVYAISNGVVGWVDLDGVDDYLEIQPNETLQMQEMTLSVWVSPDNAGTGNTGARNIINNYQDQYDFGLEMSGTPNNTWAIKPKVGFDLANNQTGSYEDLFIYVPQAAAGSWYHLALVRTKTFQIKTYVNGVLLKTYDANKGFTAAITQYHNNPMNTVRIGRRHGSGTQFFDGKISDVRLIANDLSDADVKTIFQTTVSNYLDL